jgi:inositol-phosphate transport system permease protein
VTLLIAIYFVLRSLQLYNTIQGVMLVKVALELPLGMWLMKGFFDNVPWDIERAAMVDGASRFRIWWQIVLPLIRPGIAALAIFSFISGWNEFLIPYTFILNRQQATLAVYLQQLVGDSRFVDYGQVAAIGLFQLLPVVLFFLFTQRYLLSIYAGGVKGGS